MNLSQTKDKVFEAKIRRHRKDLILVPLSINTKQYKAVRYGDKDIIFNYNSKGFFIGLIDY